MGQDNSSQLFVQPLGETLKAREAEVEQQQVQKFLEFVEQLCPWFSMHGMWRHREDFPGHLPFHFSSRAFPHSRNDCSLFSQENQSHKSFHLLTLDYIVQLNFCFFISPFTACVIAFRFLLSIFYLYQNSISKL